MVSLNLQITMNIFKFWIHLENQPPDSIANYKQIMISSFLSSGVKCCAFLDILDVITVKGIQRYPTILILWSVFQRVQLYN